MAIMRMIQINVFVYVKIRYFILYIHFGNFSFSNLYFVRVDENKFVQSLDNTVI